MERTERFYRICHLLNSKRTINRQFLMDDMEVSRATIGRDLEYLTDRMGAPIIWDRSHKSFRFDLKDAEHPFELPGLWFNASEIYALLVMEHLLENLQPGLLTPHIQPLRETINKLLEKSDHSIDEIQKRIKILPLASRGYQLKPFEIICGGLLVRKQLKIEQYNRQLDEVITRDVSPLHLVYYRDNWYLDAWCHLRNNLRTFSLDTIQKADLTKKKAKNISEQKLDNHFAPGYGIFSGKVIGTAKLLFTPERSQWVSKEEWHPKQRSNFDKEGNYILEFPYSDERELIMDILKYGPDVEVLEPDSLRKSISERLRSTLKIYI